MAKNPWEGATCPTYPVGATMPTGFTGPGEAVVSDYVPEGPITIEFAPVETGAGNVGMWPGLILCDCPCVGGMDE
jgi:hypothetical protein